MNTLLKGTPTLSQIKAAGVGYHVRSIEEDHGGDKAVVIYDVLHFDGETCRYSEDVYDTEAEARQSTAALGLSEPPLWWDVYTPTPEAQ